MMQTNGYAKYREQSVMTAGPGGLVLLLYDGCIKQLKLAKIADSEAQKTRVSSHLIKAQEIISELVNGLNFEISLSQQLYTLYEYLSYELVQANLKQDMARVDTVLDMVSDLRQTWVQVIQEARQLEQTADAVMAR